ncbi:MAG: MBL fold metallo-hydrolase [Acidimicrobiia bacterium]|nr:MBL fold metallo-hydrolase [Acidimicrobiia bacterium]
MSAPRPVAGPAVVVLGARGSIPVSGPDFNRYGGWTSCFAIVDGPTVLATVDAGTGLLAMSTHGYAPAAALSVFLTHYHWDHIQGVSMMTEFWDGDCRLTFYGPGDAAAALGGSIRPPWFPVSVDQAPHPVAYRDVDEPVSIGPVRVSSFPVNHPQGAVGYRIDGANRSVAIVTDHESTQATDAVVIDAVRGCDTLIHDAQYLPEEAKTHVGWGHSTWEAAVGMAREVGASDLVLTSHDPRRVDDGVDALVVEAARQLPATVAAAPGLRIGL